MAVVERGLLKALTVMTVRFAVSSSSAACATGMLGAASSRALVPMWEGR
jgi:hypothetical protein